MPEGKTVHTHSVRTSNPACLSPSASKAATPFFKYNLEAHLKNNLMKSVENLAQVLQCRVSGYASNLF
jgi:hypothetical protein